MSSVDDAPAAPPEGRDLALRRGTAATALLRRAARVAQEDSLPVSSLPAILRPRGTIEEGEGGWFSVVIRVTFLLVFVVPTVCIVGYFGFIASDQYASEARFSLRNGEASALEQAAGLGALTASGALSLVQDTIVITNYVTSRPVVEKLQAEIDLRSMFTRDDIDPLSAFNPDGTIEDLVRYWAGHVKVSVDGLSGLTSLTVQAFTPEDALVITRALMRHSEDLVNSLQDRTIAALVQDTQTELGRSEARLKETRSQLQALRNAKGTLDPGSDADGFNQLLGQLRHEKAQAENELVVMSGRLSPSAPQLKPVRARIAAIKAQIERLEADMTGGVRGNTDDLSGTLTTFEHAELENEIAERRYASAVGAMEAARLSAERQRIYLTPFVEPQLAQDPSAPPRLLYCIAGLFGPFLAWAAFVGITAFVRRKVL
jgi:capsular polysaccharide transport system permease protein